jgi:Ca-activated chloride channel family protein
MGLTALLLTSAAPAQVGAPQRTIIPPPPENSPVKCRMGQPDDMAAAQNMVVTGSRRSARKVYAPALRESMVAPSPMVAPPPPPAPGVPPPPSQGVMNTYNVAPAPYGSAQNTERYDGKAVASILSVAEQPVSTFSVDVDTGSYANVRRFLSQGGLPPAEAVRTEEMINYFRYDYPRPTDSSQPFSVTTDVAKTPWNPDTRLLRIGLRGYDVATDARPRANLVFRSMSPARWTSPISCLWSKRR